MDCELARLQVKLIEEVFPWGEFSFPARSAPARQRMTVELWLTQYVQPYRLDALALAARFHRLLQEHEAETTRREGTRLFARIDTSALTKSPRSILEKLARRWSEDGGVTPPFDFRQLEALEDLGRFRVVTNFLSDAEAVVHAIEGAYAAIEELDRASARFALVGEFDMPTPQFRSSLHEIREKTGERSCKGHFCSRTTPTRSIEVQIQTQLQEAWDKKDHYLIYEPLRRGGPVQRSHQSEMNAVSAMLYIADRTFDRLRSEVLAARADVEAQHASTP